MDSEAKNYEIAYLISPDVAEDEVFGEAGKITGFIQDAHGLVGHIEEPRARRLAYPMKKFRNAYFGWMSFTATPERIADLEKRVRAEKSVIRFFISEEVKRPAAHARPMREMRRAPRESLEDVKPFEPQAAKEEDKVKIEELDKRLEEILGK